MMRRIALGVLLCGLAAAMGCGGKGPAAGTFAVMLTTDPDTLDPARSTDTNSGHVILQLYEGLVTNSEQNQIAPALAERWDTSPDGRTFTFHLRAAKFHTGRAMTAADVAYSLNRCLADNESPVRQTYLGDIVGSAEVMNGHAAEASGIRVLDEHTVAITIDAPKPFFLAKLTYPTAFVVDRETIERLGPRWTESGPVGTGPFTFVEWQHNQQVLLKRFDDYWGEKAQVDFVEMHVTSDPTTRRARYESGAAHVSDIQTSDLPDVRANATLSNQLKVFLRPSIFYIGMNGHRDPTFADPWVRLAFALAIDRTVITNTVLNNVTGQANSFIAPFIPGHDDAYPGTPYDPALARECLARAGYGPNKPFPSTELFYASQYADVPRVIQAASQMLKENLQIDIKPTRLEWNTLLARDRQSDFGLYSLDWFADYLDPQNFVSVLLHSQSQNNHVQFYNQTFDWLCDLGDVEQDPKQREQWYRLADRVAVEAAPWIPIYYGYFLYLVSPQVEHYPYNLMGPMPYNTVRLKPG